MTYALASAPAHGQLAEEVFVPEPTQLHTAATSDGSEIMRSELVSEIDSADATEFSDLIADAVQFSE